MIRQWILLCLGLLLTARRSHQIHKLMNDEEIRQVFHTDRHSVPPYEVVPLWHSDIGENSKELNIRLKAFGEDVNLYLNPVEGTLFTEDTPVYTVKSNKSYPNGLKYTLASGSVKDQPFKIYEDPKKMASIAAYQGEDGSIHFSGPYGDNFVLRVLPKRVMKLVSNNKKYHDRPFLPRDSESNGNLGLAAHHIVLKYTVKKDTGEFTNKSIEIRRNSGKNSFENTGSDSSMPKGVPDVVYPELLVIVDYDTFKSHDCNLKKTILYYAAFFNAVDLKYRALEKPKVRFHIAGIIVALDREATPFLNDKRIKDNSIDSSALDAMCVYLYKEKRFPMNSYDVAITITNSNLRECKKDGKQLSSCVNLRGISKYGTACDWDHETKRVESAALVHDAGFDGIATAAHEIGHVFGVPHDGSPSLPYVGGPGAQNCKWEDGYLMSSSRHDKNALTWSPCSRTCFKYFFKKPQSSCIYNEPKSDGATPRRLPGKLLSLDEQCLRATGNEACWHDARVCTLLWCKASGDNDDCVASTPAAEGSYCGNEKMCILGRCMKKNIFV